MKITNYKYGYIPVFDCVINGKITMSSQEFGKVKKYLLRTPKMEYTNDRDFRVRMLKEDLQRKIELKNSYLVNIRVLATELIVNHYKLNGYKRNNYMLEVVNGGLNET